LGHHNPRLASLNFFFILFAVIGLLRFVGVLNAAVWLGSVIFFTFVAGPAFFSHEMLSFLPRGYAGAAAQVVIRRYFTLQEICGTIAVTHLIAEWLYSGRPIHRVMLGLLVGIIALGLIGGHWLQPRLRQLHSTMYAKGSTFQQKEQAERTFRILHAVAQIPNCLVIAGLLVYLWQVTNPPSPTRFFSVHRFKG
jgi:Domain of unknown function (DUF4149)